MTKFHTRFRPGDLVRDKETKDEGVITEAVAIWYDKYGMALHCESTERKQKGSTYCEGQYAIYPKTLDGSLNGAWYKDNQIELVEKGFLH